jgi:hypothetical protein
MHSPPQRSALRSSPSRAAGAAARADRYNV